jgi:FkbM family methyltransferase
MRVDKLVSQNQQSDWFERITAECGGEYPLRLIDDLNKDSVIIDGGCNVGGFTQIVKDKFRKIIPIDASSYNCDEYEKHHGIRPIHRALYSKDNQSVKLQKFMNGENDTNSGNFGITETALGHQLGWVSEDWEEVRTISLETILEGIEEEEIGLLKSDIEGAEYDFLMDKDLSSIKWITMELHNFLGGVKQKKLMTWIENTHIEVYSNGDGNDSNFLKLWKRK